MWWRTRYAKSISVYSISRYRRWNKVMDDTTKYRGLLGSLRCQRNKTRHSRFNVNFIALSWLPTCNAWAYNESSVVQLKSTQIHGIRISSSTENSMNLRSYCDANRGRQTYPSVKFWCVDYAWWWSYDLLKQAPVSGSTLIGGRRIHRIGLVYARGFVASVPTGGTRTSFRRCI